MFHERFRAQIAVREQLAGALKVMEREEEASSLALRQFVRFHAKAQQSWEVERTLLETKVIELENTISSETEEREKSTKLMREFKRDGGDVIKKLRESLHKVTDKYRQEVENSIHIAEQLHSVQCDYESLRQRTGEVEVRHEEDTFENEKMAAAMQRERKLHKTECEALEMKLQELSLMSNEEAQANDQLQEMLQRANADRERLQSELNTFQSGPQGNQGVGSHEAANVLPDGVDAPETVTDLEQANAVILTMSEQLKKERDMRLQTEEQTAVMQDHYENSMGLLEHQNKDLAAKLQIQKGEQAKRSTSTPRGGRPGVAAKPKPELALPKSAAASSEGPQDVDLALLKEEMMRTITSIQQSLDNEPDTAS
eukprot:TRINITY_DN30810_c0_g1_i1.p1 TRINITY_DN30810_c0_g1~~TRINITY_DN30810_c0_g1_i1.p1  ORF type:complete len:370 (+),score=131.99 TRINITY_DN30810_c0_g1_i1:240-1349(+)